MSLTDVTTHRSTVLSSTLRFSLIIEQKSNFVDLEIFEVTTFKRERSVNEETKCTRILLLAQLVFKFECYIIIFTL